MSTFEVYYVVQKDKKQVDKIVAGPYYELYEALDTKEKLQDDCSHRNRSFELMAHMMELIKFL